MAMTYSSFQLETDTPVPTSPLVLARITQRHKVVQHWDSDTGLRDGDSWPVKHECVYIYIPHIKQNYSYSSLPAYHYAGASLFPSPFPSKSVLLKFKKKKKKCYLEYILWKCTPWDHHCAKLPLYKSIFFKGEGQKTGIIRSFKNSHG